MTMDKEKLLHLHSLSYLLMSTNEPVLFEWRSGELVILIHPNNFEAHMGATSADKEATCTRLHSCIATFFREYGIRYDEYLHRSGRLLYACKYTINYGANRASTGDFNAVR